MNKKLPTQGSRTFDKLLMTMLGYSQCRRFDDAVKRAMTSCEKSGSSAVHHFVSASKPIVSGKLKAGTTQ